MSLNFESYHAYRADPQIGSVMSLIRNPSAGERGHRRRIASGSRSHCRPQPVLDIFLLKHFHR